MHVGVRFGRLISIILQQIQREKKLSSSIHYIEDWARPRTSLGVAEKRKPLS
jgi:hypothetical protein